MGHNYSLGIPEASFDIVEWVAWFIENDRNCLEILLGIYLGQHLDLVVVGYEI
jgi:hypothetical protein